MFSYSRRQVNFMVKKYLKNMHITEIRKFYKKIKGKNI